MSAIPETDVTPGVTPDVTPDVAVDPRVARSRAKVLEAATDLLVEGGARNVTVDAVAERSGVAKSTMYRHFPSRADLLVAVLRHNMPKPDLDLPTGSFDDMLRGAVHHFAATLSDPEWTRILPALIALKNTVPDIHELTEADRAGHLDQLQAILDQGVSEGVIPAGADAATTINLLVGPLMFAALNNDIEGLDALADEVVDRYIASCRAR